MVLPCLDFVAKWFIWAQNSNGVFETQNAQAAMESHLPDPPPYAQVWAPFIWQFVIKWLKQIPPNPHFLSKVSPQKAKGMLPFPE